MALIYSAVSTRDKWGKGIGAIRVISDSVLGICLASYRTNHQDTKTLRRWTYWRSIRFLRVPLCLGAFVVYPKQVFLMEIRSLRKNPNCSKNVRFARVEQEGRR